MRVISPPFSRCPFRWRDSMGPISFEGVPFLVVARPFPSQGSRSCRLAFRGKQRSLPIPSSRYVPSFFFLSRPHVARSYVKGSQA
jgi:hypothetical protein